MGGSDVMCIKSVFLRGLIGRMVSKKLRQKGFDIDVCIEELKIESNGNSYVYNLNAKGNISKEAIDKIMD